MIDQPQYLTPEGYEALEKRLRYFISVRRVEVAERLRMAMEEGGELSENAEYEDAKNEQAFIEGEIMRLETILSRAEVITAPARTDVVSLASRVTIVEKGRTEEEVYTIVGSAETNPGGGRISVDSPLGKALLGKKPGDEVRVKAPDGVVVFTITQIAS